MSNEMRKGKCNGNGTAKDTIYPPAVVQTGGLAEEAAAISKHGKHVYCRMAGRVAVVGVDAEGT
eukprot:scaffold378741_cov16-Prasinocladus_malaysianus.AAC.1